MLQLTASALSSLTGDAFFGGMANLLYLQSAAEFVIIGQYQQGMVNTQAVLKNGQVQPDFRYSLAGTPCEQLMGGQCCFFNQGVAELFPGDDMLAEEAIQSYLGRALHDSDGNPLGLIALLFKTPTEPNPLLLQMLDLCALRTSAEMARLEQIRHLKYLSEHDPLTGLYNRTRLNQATDQLDSLNAMLVLDINAFKDINDTLGHSTGDRLLVALADRLRALQQEQHLEVYRLGGDEFAVLVLDNTSPTELCERIGQQLARTFTVDGVNFNISAGIGVALAPDHGQELESLLRCADVAMYGAKRSGQLWQCYNEKQDSNSPQRLALLHGVAEALEKDQFQLLFQPSIAMADNSLVGVEALLRWHHPSQGFIPPGQFIPLVEQTEHIRELSLWVMEKALGQIAQWQQQGLTIAVAINLSGTNLGDNGFVFRAMKLLDSMADSAPLLEVEITESAFISNHERAGWIMRQFRQRGVRIAIDDFGTGYSSLSYLHQLPLDKLKVDRSFILNMMEDNQAKAIVKSIIELAHSIGLEVTAEGIETPEVAEQLLKMGADNAQGYLYGKPMTAEALDLWLHQGQKKRAIKARGTGQ